MNVYQCFPMKIGNGYFIVTYKHNPIVMTWSNIDVLLRTYLSNYISNIFMRTDGNSIGHYFNVAYEFNKLEQSCVELKQQFLTLYASMLSQYDELRQWAIVEQHYNDTLAKKCQDSVNRCGSHLLLEQKATRYSTSQLVYFFKHFGHHYNGYITSLNLVKSMTTEEAEIISLHICNINILYLLNSETYELGTLRKFTREISNCPNGSKLSAIIIDYYLMKRTLEYVTTNEMPLKKIHNVEQMVVRLLTNTKRGFKLLRNNILLHHHLPSYKLRYLKIITKTLTPQCCDYLTEIIPFVETIIVIPFDGFLYANYTVNHCKAIILKFVTELPIDSRFEVIFLQDWELKNGSEWIVRTDFEMDDRKEKSFDDEDVVFYCFFGILFIIMILFSYYLLFRSSNFLFFTLFLIWISQFLFWIPGEDLLGPVYFPLV